MKVVIIYNPNSTGNGFANAKELAQELKEGGAKVTIRKTTHAGHGEEIAMSYARSGESLVLISSSGDGGYHEVVNGALATPSPGLVVGVLPSGNANDHHSALGGDALAHSILRKHVRKIDTIKVSATIDGKPWTRYAHSYAGIGVTAVAAKRLTDDRPNAFTEKWIVAHSLFSFHSTKIKKGRKVKRYSSILFGNIDRMSKVLKLSEGSSVSDGKFEMSAIRFRSKLRLIAYLFGAATIGVKDARSMKRYTFSTVSELPIQLDGESYVIDAKSKVVVESVRRNLHCVL